MPLPPTLPRRSWLEQLSFVLAALLIAIGAIALAGWWFHVDLLVQPIAPGAAIKANEALSIVLLGVALIVADFGWAGASWIALAPAAIAALSLIESLLRVNLHIDEFLAVDRLLTETAQPGRMSTTSATCLLLVALTLVWRGFRRGARWRLFAEAVVSSVTASAGLSTLLGYAANLPAVYHWGGSATATSSVGAAALLLLGLGLLVFAWRETMRTEGGPPAWSPMPVVVGCFTLTIIFWIGLRERERVYLAARTQTSMDTLATAINFEFSRQSADMERLARLWGDLPPESTDEDRLRSIDAQNQWEDSSGNLGCVSISVLDGDGRAVWVYPPEQNATAIAYNHNDDPVRHAAIESARSSRATVISGTTPIAGRDKGVVIYAPIIHGGVVSGYVAAEFYYRPFFTAVISTHKLRQDYRINIKVGTEQVYDSTGAAANAGASELTLDKAYTIFSRRIRITLAPSDESLEQSRRFLPELALAAGIGITFLLGLSVHLARNARIGQRAAELSNRKLHAENEERRRVEARLKISDERLRLALDSTQIGIFEWNVAAGHVYYSSGLWAMLGYDHALMPSSLEAWQTLIHPDDLAFYRGLVDAQLGGTVAFIEPEYRVRARNGDWRWVYTRSKTVASTTAGRPARIIGTVQDVTARREAEHALRESQAEARKLSLVASKTDNPVLITSPDGTIEWVNESYTRVMEFTLDEVVGKVPTDFMRGPDSDQTLVHQIRAAMRDGLGLSTDVVSYSKSGRKYHLRLELQPVRNDAGELQNFIAIETDITARVQTEQALRRAKQEADEASRAKSDFLASMSHEIRTPMNGVIGMTSLLMETRLDGEQREFVNTIRTSGEALLTIINDILDFSKIESGMLELEHTPFDLAVCIEEALDLFALQVSTKKLELVYCVGPDVPPWIVGDVTRLRQVIVNLVNNAVKFTPSGSVAIEVHRLPAPDTRSPRFMLEFAVRDTGIGIPADRVDRLFKAFSQVDSSTTRKFGGTGLGLAISQRLSILMGGGIRVESGEGSGSTFVFTIATEAAALGEDVVPIAGLDRLADCTVLCVEDHPVTRQRIRALLEPHGATCHFATHAAEALELAPRLAPEPGLLVIKGDETAGTSPLDAVLPVRTARLLMLPFGQTAPAAPADGQPFATIFKPFKTSSFLQAIADLLSPAPVRPVAHRPISALGSRVADEFPLEVLLAEDNIVNQKVALRFLERLGYRANSVSNGNEALKALESRPYDLVLMDLQMPEMDGLEASRQIRRRLPVERQPKIVALTANAMQGDRERCLAAGMDDYISKPVKLHEIEAIIRRLFGRSDVPAPPQMIS
ncbi:MAG TPA: response regulator [Opitutus sp.]|nr:response regulator [Opitutus sp.]